MAIIDNVAVFAPSVNTNSGSITIPNEIEGSDLKVFVLGGGGAGAGAPNTSGDTQNKGGGGGGAGGSIDHTLTVQAGDVIEIVAANSVARNTGTTPLNGNFSRIIQKRGGNEIARITANGGSGGGSVTGGAGGTVVATGGAAGATGTTGGAGGAGADNSGSTEGNSSGGSSAGGPSGGAAGFNGSDQTALTLKTAGGGGGGASDAFPTWVQTVVTGAGLTRALGAGDGGNGGSSSAHTPGTRGDAATDTTFYSMDGKGSPTAGFQFAGLGGGGGGIPWFTNGGTDAWGGAGGEGIVALSYQYDAPAPVITLNGDATINLNFGEEYFDLGASATVRNVATGQDDQLDASDITVTLPTQLQPGSIPAVSTTGYTVTYTATSDDGVTSTATRTVTVTDNTGPVISLVGSAVVQVRTGDTYNDAGANAVDNLDSSVTITTTSTVDTSTPGTYTVTYTATDAAGNAADSVVRTVIVGDVVYDVANTTRPMGTPASGQISFSDIQRATQLFKIGEGQSSYSQTSLGGDASIRYLQRLSINDLRLWWVKYGFHNNAGTVSNATDIGRKGTSPLRNRNADESLVAMSNFRHYAALSIATNARGESYDVYRNYDNAALRVYAWGANHSNVDTIYTISITRPSDDGGGTIVQTGAGGTTELFGDNLGGRKSSSIGTGSGSHPASLRDDHATHTYPITVTWKNTSGGSNIVYNGASIQLGHVGFSSVCRYTNGHGTAFDYKWNGSSKTGNGFSSTIIDHVGFNVIENL